MRVVFALLATILVVVNAASSALYYSEIAYLDAGCNTTHVGGSATLVSASCIKGADDFYYGVRCSDDNLSVSSIRCPATDATCTSTACTVVSNVPQCSAASVVYLRKRCYATAADVPLVRTPQYVSSSTYTANACSGPLPVRILNVPVNVCSNQTPTPTQSSLVSCTASSLVTRTYNSTTSCTVAPVSTVTIPNCVGVNNGGLTTYTAVSCYGASNATTTSTSSTSGTGGNTGGTTTGPINSAVYLGASAFMALFASLLIAAF